MSDIAEVTESSEPQPMTFRVRGVEYNVLPFSMIQVGKIQRAINSMPCPHNTRAVRKEMSAKLAGGECTQDEVNARVGATAAREEEWPPRLMENSEAQSLLYYEEPVQVAMVRTALKLTDDATGLDVLGKMTPLQYMELVAFCFQIGREPDGPKDPAPSSGQNGSTTTNSSATSSPAPDGQESMSSA